MPKITGRNDKLIERERLIGTVNGARLPTTGNVSIGLIGNLEEHMIQL